MQNVPLLSLFSSSSSPPVCTSQFRARPQAAAHFHFPSYSLPRLTLRPKKTERMNKILVGDCKIVLSRSPACFNGLLDTLGCSSCKDHKSESAKKEANSVPLSPNEAENPICSLRHIPGQSSLLKKNVRNEEGSSFCRLYPFTFERRCYENQNIFAGGTNIRVNTIKLKDCWTERPFP